MKKSTNEANIVLKVNVLSFSLVDGATEYEVRFEAVTCIQAHAICFEKVNKGARFVYYCSFKTNFCEDRSKIPNSTVDFQPVLCSVNKKVLT